MIGKCTIWNQQQSEMNQDLYEFNVFVFSDYELQLNVLVQTRAARNFVLTQKIAKLEKLIAWDQTFLKACIHGIKPLFSSYLMAENDIVPNYHFRTATRNALNKEDIWKTFIDNAVDLCS